MSLNNRYNSITTSNSFTNNSIKIMECSRNNIFLNLNIYFLIKYILDK